MEKINLNISLHYFEMKEFDQPGKPGSGVDNMDINLLMILDNMRHRAKIPFIISSAFRSKIYKQRKIFNN